MYDKGNFIILRVRTVITAVGQYDGSFYFETREEAEEYLNELDDRSSCQIVEITV